MALEYTEWWKCLNCYAQWFVPEDYEEHPDECPFCGHSEHTLMKTNRDEQEET